MNYIKISSRFCFTSPLHRRCCCPLVLLVTVRSCDLWSRTSRRRRKRVHKHRPNENWGGIKLTVIYSTGTRKRDRLESGTQTSRSYRGEAIVVVLVGQKFVFRCCSKTENRFADFLAVIAGEVEVDRDETEWPGSRHELKDDGEGILLGNVFLRLGIVSIAGVLENRFMIGAFFTTKKNNRGRASLSPHFCLILPDSLRGCFFGPGIGVSIKGHVVP